MTADILLSTDTTPWQSKNNSKHDTWDAFQPGLYAYGALQQPSAKQTEMNGNWTTNESQTKRRRQSHVN